MKNIFAPCLVLFPFFFISVCCLYFDIPETSKKCFIEEIPDETTVSILYKVELFDPRTNGFMSSAPGVGMHVEVEDPDKKVILSRVYTAEGNLSFMSNTPGEHEICLYSNSTKWFGGTQLVITLNKRSLGQGIAASQKPKA